MWEKKVYPLDKSKKSKGIRKQRHHAVSTNHLLVPDKRGTSTLRPIWSRLNYGSAGWMLSQLVEDFDDSIDDYDNDDNMGYADGDVTDDNIGTAECEGGDAEREVGEVDTDWVERWVYDVVFGDDEDEEYGPDMAHADDEVGENVPADRLSEGIESEKQEEAVVMGYFVVERGLDVECEDGWTLIPRDI